MNKQQAIKIITESAIRYKENFVGKNYLYIYSDKQALKYIETVFSIKNFLHLTGVDTDLTPTQFYKKCINHKLSPKDFEFKADGTTQLKMKILPTLLQMNKGYKMLGMYNNSKPRLFTDKLAGSQYCCMGFISNGKNYFVPNTILQEDIRDLTVNTYRIIAIYSKAITDNTYSDNKYIAKGISKIDIDEFVKQLNN